MGHTLRKYLSNRGSALFMVISTMTALFISCMAMYFSMASARSSQNVVFNKLQANQSAMSISRIVANGISSYSEDEDSLYQMALNMEVGESITTDAGGFKSLDPNNETGLDLEQLGAYSVTITCVGKDANGNVILDVMVVTSVDGNRDSIHMSVTINETTPDAEPGQSGAGGDAELFAATGYVPNDAYISGGYYLTDVFYDTQFTYMNTFGGSGENRIGQNLSTGGDLMLGADAMSVVHSASGDAISSEDVAKIGAVTWAIRGNFYPSLGNDMGMRGGSQILVGGDYINNSGNNSFYVKNDGYYKGSSTLDDHICIYVNGDFIYSGSDLKSNTWIFVNGNVSNIGWNAQNNAKIFITGNAEERAAKTANLNTNTPIYEWPITGTFDQGLNYTEAMELLGQKTQTISYYKWDLSGNTNTTSTKHIDIRINAKNEYWTYKGVTYEPYLNTYVIAYPGSESAALIKDNGGNELGAEGKTFIIDSVMTNGDNDTGQTILIDTGEDENNIMTIKLSDVTGNNEFSWFLESSMQPPTWAPNGNVRAIIVKGRGTVLIDVPNGITYQDAGFQFTGHIGWFLIEGGRMDTKGGHITFTGVDPRGKYSATIIKYVHKLCEEGDGCVFSFDKPTTSKCNECGGTLTQVTCNVHGDVNKYCKSCHPEKNDRKDWCTNHFDTTAFDTFYASLSPERKALVTDSKGATIYPNTNFMLVSCDESAEMRFTQLTGEWQYATYNTLFGFIYAPYMSYLAAGGEQGGGLLKLVGGMTVGDYDIQAINGYIGCYPDHMPNELAGMVGGGSMAGGKLTGTSKSWKVEVGGYR